MASPLKIAYILPSLAPKAPVFIAQRLADYFVSKGNKVEVFYFDEIYGTEFNCKTTGIKMSEPIDFDSFDIIHSHMFRPDKYIAKYSSRIKKAKTVSTVHCCIKDDLHYSYGKIISEVFSRKWISYLKKLNCTVQINDYLLNLYKKDLPQSRLIYNGISTAGEKDDYSEIFSKIMTFKHKGLFVLCSYSGLVERKGLMQILRLLKTRSDLAYVCIGEGEQKKSLLDFAVRNNISDRIYFSPFKKNPYFVMEKADIFMIPSYSEGFSLALLEAGTIGSSVVCSDIPAFNMPFSKNEVSFFTLDSIESLSSVVDEALKCKKGKSAALKSKIIEQFSEAAMFERYEALYNQLAARRWRKS